MIQIDMPMPENCRVCPACSEYDICLIPIDGKGFGEQNVSEFIENRPEWCPMREQEAKAGKWIPIESPTGVEAFGVKEMTVMDVRCSVCGSEEDVSFTGYKYCPRCGAKMKDGEQG